MQFSTKIEIPRPEFFISHEDHIMMLGSCFAENIGTMLLKSKFDVNLNPFGILYNPVSVSQAMNKILRKEFFTEKDIFEYRGLYHSFFHHGCFSDVSKEKCLEKINASMQSAIEDLQEVKFLFVTFGTSYVYELKESSEVVGNCHKLPASLFTRYRLTVESIVNDWTALLNQLTEYNSNLQVILTVSPIRHLKDGAHENQLSKSVLLLAIDELCKQFDNIHYFPSYEIVLDELRDYRFYAEDMVHPNSTAIKYLWEKFSNIYFSDDSKQIINEWNKIDAAINHRPINPNSEEYKHFLNQTILKLDTFNAKYPYICCNTEHKELDRRLEDLNEIFNTRNS